MRVHHTIILVFALIGCNSDFDIDEEATSLATASQALTPPCLRSGSLDTPASASDPYLVTNSIKLCENTVYTQGFEFRANNVTLDCNGASIDGASFSRSIISRGYHGITIMSSGPKCNIINAGIAISGTADESATGIVPADGVTLQNISVSDGKQSGIIANIAHSEISNCSFLNNAGVGLYLNAESHNNVIKSNLIMGNGRNGDSGTGIALDAAYSNEIFGNQIIGKGSALLASQRYGITIYRNCGESGTIARSSEAHSNYIHNNTIVGHHAPSFSLTSTYDNSHSIVPGAAITVGLRQGKTLKGQQDWKCSSATDFSDSCFKYATSQVWGEGYPAGSICNNGEPCGLCNDASYERLNWDPRSSAYKTAIRSKATYPVGGRMYALTGTQRYQYNCTPNAAKSSVTCRDTTTGAVTHTCVKATSGAVTCKDTSGNSITGEALTKLLRPVVTTQVDRHFDYAPNTDIEANVIADNDVGILVQDQETRIVSNLFAMTGENYQSKADIIIGNKYLDTTKSGAWLPTRYVRAMWGNTFRAPNACMTTSAAARSRVFGTDSSYCTATYSGTP